MIHCELGWCEEFCSPVLPVFPARALVDWLRVAVQRDGADGKVLRRVVTSLLQLSLEPAPGGAGGSG